MEKRTDWLLSTLIEAATASDSGSAVDVVLFLPGQVISGTIISQRRFFERLSEVDVYADTGWDEIASTVTQREKESKKRQNEIREDLRARGIDNPTEDDLREYDSHKMRLIHLENVKLMVPGQPLIPIEIWRGSLLDVVGWTFGNIGRSTT